MIGFTEAQIMAWFTPIFWPFIRILGIFSTAPIFSARSVSWRTRISLAFFISLCAQATIPEFTAISLNDRSALFIVFQQAMIGMMIGMIARIVYSAVELAGEISGLQMGLNFAGYFDPVTGAQSSATGRYYGNITMLMMIALNGHLLLVQTVIDSFHTFPIGEDNLQIFANRRLHEVGSVVFSYGLLISLPIIGVLLFVNAVLGILSRVAPQMNVFAVGFPLTLTAGLISLVITTPLLEQPIVRLISMVDTLLTGP